MANVQQVMSSYTGTPAATGQFNSVLAGATVIDNDTTETNVDYIVRTAGVFSNLYVNCPVNTNASNGTWRFRVNGANGNQIVTILANTTGDFVDNLNTDSVSAGDLVDATAATNIDTTNEISILSVSFAANSNTVGRFGSFSVTPFGISSASTTLFYQFFGPSGVATESQVQIQFNHACVLQQLQIVCTTKGRSKADTVTLRKNAANGNLTVSVTGTGTFEDNTHTDSIAANDKVDFSITTGSGSGADNFRLVAMEQSSTDSTFHSFPFGPNAGFGQTGYSAFGGQLSSQLGSADAVTKTEMLFAGTLQGLSFNVLTNTVNGTTTYTLNKNSIGTSVTASAGASATGFFQDTTHSASVVVGDHVNFLMTVGGSSGAIAPGICSIYATVSAPPTPPMAVVFPVFGDPDFQWLGGDGDMGSF